MAEQKKKSSSAGSTRSSGTSRTRGMSAAEKERIQKRRRIKDEICAILIVAVGAFLLVSLQTHAAGQFGELLQQLFKGLFGVVAYGLPYYLIVYGLLLLAKRATHITGKSAIFLSIIFLMATILNSSRFLEAAAAKGWSFERGATFFSGGITNTNGGFFGMLIGFGLYKLIGMVGIFILCIAVIVICVLLVINTPLSHFMEKLQEKRQAAKEVRYMEQMAAEMEAEAKAEVAAKAAAGAAAVGPLSGVQQKMTLPETRKKKKPFDFSVQPEAAPAPEPGKGLGEEDKKDPEIVKEPEALKSFLEDKLRPEEKEVLDELKSLIPKDDEPAPSIVSNAAADTALELEGITAGQKKILEYMRDDQLFGEKSTASFGYGLDGTPGEEATAAAVGSAAASKAAAKAEAAKAEAEPIVINTTTPGEFEYKLPPVTLLKKAPAEARGKKEDPAVKAAKLEAVLHDFGVNAKVTNVTQGSTVTRYEVQPSVGVKVQSIVRLADDIALNMEAKSIRIEAPIPGKAAVGIEIENEKFSMVALRDIIDSPEFKNEKSKLTFALGKDIGGKSMVADLKSMPHMLIAGSTGSGKSVCINGILMSVLYKAKPDEVKLILIDPKVVELGNYNGIPHLMVPVVTNPAKAAATLGWAVTEMLERYNKFAEEGVRDLASYNETVRANQEDEKAMPQIVIIIDELADLMMAASKQVEEYICRLAQMARAAGMHLIVATQRPSVDVVTGLIKNNIPSRIAFAVTSSYDSKTIIDMVGAERLVGKGDMLFAPQGTSKPTRIQGAFVSNAEIQAVIDFWKEQGVETTYSSDILQAIEKGQGGGGSGEPEDDNDDLLAEAIEATVQEETISVSKLQRRFRIGYNRAARLIEMMEARGIVGPADGSRPRKVLITQMQWASLGADPEE